MKIEDLIDKLQGINHAEVARRAGVTRAYVNAIANGARLNPTYQTMCKIGAAADSVRVDDERNKTYGR